jgi:hypothetical protein
MDEFSIKYTAVVLSTAITDALAGTAIVEIIGKFVPAPAAALLIATVAFTALAPFTLAHTIWLILKTRPEDAVLDNRVLAVVFAGVRYVVLPVRVVTLIIFGFAMVVPYRPKTIEKAMA